MSSMDTASSTRGRVTSRSEVPRSFKDSTSGSRGDVGYWHKCEVRRRLSYVRCWINVGNETGILKLANDQVDDTTKVSDYHPHRWPSASFVTSARRFGGSWPDSDEARRIACALTCDARFQT